MDVERIGQEKKRLMTSIVVAATVFVVAMAGSAWAASPVTNPPCTAWATIGSSHVAGSYYSYYGRIADYQGGGSPDPDCTQGSLQVELIRGTTLLDFDLDSMAAGIDSARASSTQLPANRPSKSRSYNCYKTPCQWVDLNF